MSAYKLLLAICVLISSVGARAQSDLVNSRTSGEHIYVYQLNKADLEALYKEEEEISEKFLHTYVTHYPCEEKTPELPRGNYLLVQAIGNKLEYNSHTVDDLYYHFPSERRFSLYLYDKLGSPIDNAGVKLNRRSLRFDAGTNTYLGPTFRKAKLLEIDHQGVYHYFRIYPQEQPHPAFRSNRRWKTNRTYRKYQSMAPTSSLIFNKPRYKPGETVRLKAFVTSSKGRLDSPTVYVRLIYPNGNDTLLTKLKPYRPGMYHYAFRLSDTLKLQLDRSYPIRLTDLEARQIYAKGSIQVEEYELKGLRLNVSSSATQHQQQNPPTISIKVTDENDMSVSDGVCTISVDPITPYTFLDTMGFVPTKLWSHEISMNEPGGKTISLPDSIFPPNVSFHYRVFCVYQSSDRERHTEQLRLYYNGSSTLLQCTPTEHGVSIAQVTGGHTDTTTALIRYHLLTGEVIACDSVTLPFLLRLSPTAAYYTIKTEKVQDIYSTQTHPPHFPQPDFNRNKDSLWLKIANPYGTPFHYTLLKGKRILKQGHATAVDYRKKIRGDDDYHLQLEYQIGGYFGQIEKQLPGRKNEIDIRLNTPAIVYPGQKTQMDIHLTDYKGRPIADADVTAYAVTSKLGDAVPFVPQWKKNKTTEIETFSCHQSEMEIRKLQHRMEWDRWKKEMGLDSIAYYHFLYPDSLYMTTIPARDSITQVAPYLTIKGELQPIYVIKIDDLPYYCHGTTHFPVYSFPVSPGPHTIGLRTYDSEVLLQDIVIQKGMKTILSANIEQSRPSSKIYVRPVSKDEVGHLSNAEQYLLSQHTLSVKHDYSFQKFIRSSLLLEKSAYLQSGKFLYYLNPSRHTYSNPIDISNKTIFTGPFPYVDSVTLYSDHQPVNRFIPEGGYDYTIREGYLKLQQPKLPLPLQRLSQFTPQPDFQAQVLTPKDIDRMQNQYLQEYLRRSRINFTDFTEPLRPEMIVHSYHLELNIKDTTDHAAPYLILFFNEDKTFREIYSGNTRDFRDLKVDKLQLVLLYPDSSYYQCSLRLKPNGTNYLALHSPQRRKGDHFSDWVNHFIETRVITADADLVAAQERQLSTKSPQQLPNGYKQEVSGVVISAFDGMPLVGATIRVKGTKQGTITDLQGQFTLRVPSKGTLQFSFIGCTSQEMPIQPGEHYQVYLENANETLDEIIVTGVYFNKKVTITGAVHSVEVGRKKRRGQTAAPAVEEDLPQAEAKQELHPMIILNGLPYAGSLESIDQNLITSVKRISPERAVDLYGAQGQYGVVVVTTAATAEEEQAGHRMRRNFRDDAFWQPALLTDRTGKASFEVTYPDDLTNWQAHIVAVDDKQRTGYASTSIKSFQAITSRLLLPQFAVAGDRFQAIGRMNNYLDDTIRATQITTVNDRHQEKEVVFTASRIDSIPVSVAMTDSLHIALRLQKAGNLLDGEERTLPVYPAGCREYHSVFKIINDDSVRTFRMNSAAGKTTLHAESNANELLLREIENIDIYPYLCNEQRASKLKALIAKKKIYALLNRPFEEKKKIEKLITDLLRNQNGEGLWGWWEQYATTMWITRHVIEALQTAQAEGFDVQFNKQLAREHLASWLVIQQAKGKRSSIDKREWLNTLITLKTLHGSIDTSLYLPMIDRLPNRDFYNLLLSLRVKQLLGAPVTKAEVMRHAQRTILGNLYWAKQKNDHSRTTPTPESTVIQTTLLAYEILRAMGNATEEMEQIRNYFFETRQNGYWENIYESSRIIETIFPDLITPGAPLTATKLNVNTTTIDSFPFTAEYATDTVFRVQKTGSFPVFFTAWQSVWNPKPQPVSEGFQVKTFFCQNQDTVISLQAGVTTTLTAVVTTEAEAEYVMIEIPIPAGCSYEAKDNYGFWTKAHKEYHKDKVVIFLPYLAKGKHLFTVKLNPRFTGTYHLNPAQAGLMYFPKFFGREKEKEVEIKGSR